jgi:hypothetical protein
MLYQVPYADPIIEKSALEPQNMEMNSGCDKPPKTACFYYYWLSKFLTYVFIISLKVESLRTIVIRCMIY